jgi:hypothetical protein
MPVPQKNISNAQTKTEKNNCSILYLKNTQMDSLFHDITIPWLVFKASTKRAMRLGGKSSLSLCRTLAQTLPMDCVAQQSAQGRVLYMLCMSHNH